MTPSRTRVGAEARGRRGGQRGAGAADAGGEGKG